VTISSSADHLRRRRGTQRNTLTNAGGPCARRHSFIYLRVIPWKVEHENTLRSRMRPDYLDVAQHETTTEEIPVTTTWQATVATPSIRRSLAGMPESCAYRLHTQIQEPSSVRWHK
jgi:hypothetical protein